MNTLQGLVQDRNELEQTIKEATAIFLQKYPQVIIEGAIKISRETGNLIVDLKTEIY